MLRRNGLAAIGATGVALLLGVGGVSAATRSSDERALTPVAHKTNAATERKIDALISKMTLQEKLNQLTLLSDGQITTPRRAKPVGGGVQPDRSGRRSTSYQHIAVEQSRLHIPILFAYDTIHGYRTIFPIPLGDRLSSFDPSVAQTDHRSAPSSRPRSASSRSTARWSTSRTSRAGAASPRPRARTRT